MALVPAHEDVASGGRRRRGRRSLGWGTLFCFGSQEASSAEGTTTTPWERSSSLRRSKKRTVPVVDGDLVATSAADSEVMRRGTGTGEEESRKRKGLRLPGCCFLAPPAREPAGREHSTMDCSGNGRDKQERTEQPPRRWRSHSFKNSPSEASSQMQATGGSTSTSNGSRSRGAEQARSAPPAETTTTRTPSGTKPSKTTGAGGALGASFGPAVGLSVVVAVSMAGLLLGGRLWAVACVCAWLWALSRLRRREATTAAGEVVAVDVDSMDHKDEPVVLRELLEQDRRKA